MWTLLLAGAALAQEVPETPPAIDAQNYRHSVDSTHTLWTDDAGAAPTGYFSGRLGVNYASNPLIYYPLEGGEIGVLENFLVIDAIAAINVSRLRLGVDVPLYLAANSELTGAQNGLGDVAFDLKGTIVDHKDSPVGLALAARAGLPTSSVDAALGSPAPTFEVSGILDVKVGTALIAGNLGYRNIPAEDLQGLTWDDQVVTRLGAGYGFNEAMTAGVSLDVATYATLPLPTQRELFGAEGLLGGWVKPTDSIVLRAGAGSGATPGIGTPDFRAVFALAYQPPHIRDEDGDGIVDKADDCREDPEDKDGYRDKDGCPDPTTRVRVLFVDENGDPVEGVVSKVSGEEIDQEGGSQLDFEVHPDSVKITAMADGYAPLEETLAVPDRARFKTSYELKVLKGKVVIRVKDLEGNPVDASVRVGEAAPFETKDGRRAIQAKPGTYTVMVLAEGYKPAEAEVTVTPDEIADITVTVESSRAKVTKKAIVITEKVYFDTAKATIKPESFGVLDDVYGILRAYPDIKKVRIEGHTDNRGDADYNRQLSDDRAKAVRQYLIDKGIDGSRMDAQGFGEDKPIDARNTSSAWEKNRRVEFNIVSREGFDAEGNPIPGFYDDVPQNQLEEVEE